MEARFAALSPRAAVYPAPDSKEREFRLQSCFSERCPRTRLRGRSPLIWPKRCLLALVLGRQQLGTGQGWKKPESPRDPGKPGQGTGASPGKGWVRDGWRDCLPCPNLSRDGGKESSLTLPRGRDLPRRFASLSNRPKQGVFVLTHLSRPVSSIEAVGKGDWEAAELLLALPPVDPFPDPRGLVIPPSLTD